MRNLSSHLISIVLIALFSNSANAGNNEICDALKADGVTKGLYGLCIAYHASGANSQAILDNYNKKKSDSDPLMPGTDDNPPALSCPCWAKLTVEDIGTNEESLPDVCTLIFGDDSTLENLQAGLLQYKGEGGLSEFLLVDSRESPGACIYDNTFTEPSMKVENFELSPDEEKDCLAEIYGFAIEDFKDEGFDCFPPPPVE